MKTYAMNPPLLACIPDLGGAARRESGEEVHAAKSRMINQKLSVKILSAIGLVLVAVAILPAAFFRSSPSPDFAVPSESAVEWRAETQAAPTRSTPPPTILMAQSSATEPAPAEPAAMPNMLPQANAVSEFDSPRSIESSQISPWPNPAHPISASAENAGIEPTQVGVNQAMAIRPLDPQRSRQ